MKKFTSWILFVFLISLSAIVFAHSGRTDANGGHYNRKTGEYHYHNGGPTYNSSNNSSYNQSSYSEDTKKIQLRLIELGYDPGPADGVRGQKTINAIKQFQSDNGLVADGVIGNQTRQALRI